MGDADYLAVFHHILLPIAYEVYKDYKHQCVHATALWTRFVLKLFSRIIKNRHYPTASFSHQKTSTVIFIERG